MHGNGSFSRCSNWRYACLSGAWGRADINRLPDSIGREEARFAPFGYSAMRWCDPRPHRFWFAHGAYRQNAGQPDDRGLFSWWRDCFRMCDSAYRDCRGCQCRRASICGGPGQARLPSGRCCDLNPFSGRIAVMRAALPNPFRPNGRLSPRVTSTWREV